MAASGLGLSSAETARECNLIKMKNIFVPIMLPRVLQDAQPAKGEIFHKLSTNIECLKYSSSNSDLNFKCICIARQELVGQLFQCSTVLLCMLSELAKCICVFIILTYILYNIFLLPIGKVSPQWIIKNINMKTSSNVFSCLQAKLTFSMHSLACNNDSDNNNNKNVVLHVTL